MDQIRRIVREILTKQPDKCNCGCHSCKNVGNKGPVLNESLSARVIMSENMKHHVENRVPINENLFRYGSDSFLDMWAEARYLYSRNAIHVNDTDKEILVETDLGEFGIFEGKKVPLDLLMEKIEFPFKYKGFKYSVEDTGGMVNDRGQKVWKVLIQDKNGDIEIIIVRGSSNIEGHNEAKKYIEDELSSENLTEADKKKKTPPIGKPKRGGSKKFYVYVRKKGGGIKKVSFGDTTGLSAKINNPKARQAFAKRHDCANKKDKTKASYWSCRLPRYAKLLGLKSSFSGFW
jgi:hypothetical protein